MSLDKLINQGATIIDVRSPMEFAGGSVPGAINIPLNEVSTRVEEFKSMEGPLVLCCMSGNRSGQACAFLGAQGIECYNGGSWYDVNALVPEQG